MAVVASVALDGYHSIFGSEMALQFVEKILHYIIVAFWEISHAPFLLVSRQLQQHLLLQVCISIS